MQNVLEDIYLNIADYTKWLLDSPFRVIALLIDITIVIFLIMQLVNILKNTRAWQLLKGIVLLILATATSNLLRF